ncbi:TniB family NTP-binding protein [Pseudomonas aeruginosa]
MNRLETLYAWPNKQRMPNLLLVGPTNNGKSMIVEKFRRAHPVGTDADQEHIPVLVVQMPSEPSVIRFYVALLAAMGAAPARTAAGNGATGAGPAAQRSACACW